MIFLVRQFLNFLKDITKNKWLIVELAKKDLYQRYIGSSLGLLWVFIHPLITVMVFWFIFDIGFKSKPVDDFPFILWLVTGMFPWFFFSEAIGRATTVIIDNSFLVKKIVFRVSVLPIIQIVSALAIHLFFILILFIMFYFYGYPPTIYSLQVLYYLFAMICLLLGVSWITSSLTVFLRDIGQVVAIILQFAFWLTPIFWSFKIVPIKYHFLLKLNPIYYIVEGYRNSFIYDKWFWEEPELMCIYWSITLISLVLGSILFKKLRPHFADVL